MEQFLSYEPRQAANNNFDEAAWERECQVFRGLREKRNRVAVQIKHPKVSPEQRDRMALWLARADRLLQRQRELYFQYGVPLP